jgi:hypothetical protein
LGKQKSGKQKQFFFEKKNQKTFVSLRRECATPVPHQTASKSPNRQRARGNKSLCQ